MESVVMVVSGASVWTMKNAKAHPTGFWSEEFVTPHRKFTQAGLKVTVGDLFIYIPEAKFMMAVDCVTPGYIPFSGFDITTNFDQYLRVFDELLAYDFNTFVGGHLTSIGNKQDVLETKAFTMDVYQTVKRIHNIMDQKAVVAEAAKTIGYDNEFLLFKVLLDKVTDQAVAELKPRWINRLAGVDVWLETQVRYALVYVRWDDKL